MHTADKVAEIAFPAATTEVTPFEVHVPQAALDDLKKRLANTRWPNKEPVTDWSQGVPLAKAQALGEYWSTRYDWRRVESTLNGLPQFRTQIDGLGIYFIHVRSKHENALPIVLTYEWPGSIIEFLQVIEPLADPTAHNGKAEEAFHVVVPSLPGFGFSDKPTEAGWRLPRIANAWAALMARLGYSRYVAQGGDWGAGVTSWMAEQREPGACRDSSEPSSPLPTATTTARRVLNNRAGGVGSARKVWERRFRLCVDPGDASPNTRVRSCRLAGRASDVDLREVSGM